MIRRFLSDARGSTVGSYAMVGLVVGAIAMFTAPYIGQGLDANLQTATHADASATPGVDSVMSGAGGEIALGTPGTLTNIAASGVADGGAYGDAVDYPTGGFPWNVVKGVLIVGAVVVVLALGGGPLLALGAAALLATGLELGECATGNGPCSDALDPWQALAQMPVDFYTLATDGEARQAMIDGFTDDPWGFVYNGFRDMAEGCFGDGDSGQCMNVAASFAGPGAAGRWAATKLLLRYGGTNGVRVGNFLANGPIRSGRGALANRFRANGIDNFAVEAIEGGVFSAAWGRFRHGKGAEIPQTPHIDPETFGAGCFAAGTMVSTSGAGQAIETIALGQRVITTGADHLSTDTRVDDTWRVFHMRMPLAGGTEMRIEALRPAHWAPTSGTTFVSIEELGLAGDAQVLSTSPAPKIEAGNGFVVTTTFTKIADDMLRLTFDESDQVLDATSNHPFFSLDRNDWVSAGELREGESLRTKSGAVKVATIEEQEDQRVYNIEVEHAHTYLVGSDKILTHNQCAAGRGPMSLERRSSLEAEAAQMQTYIDAGPDHHVVRYRDGESLIGQERIVVEQTRVSAPGGRTTSPETRLAEIRAELEADDLARANHNLNGELNNDGIEVARSQIEQAEALLPELEAEIPPIQAKLDDLKTRKDRLTGELLSAQRTRDTSDIFADTDAVTAQIDEVAAELAAAQARVTGQQRMIASWENRARHQIQNNAYAMEAPDLSDADLANMTGLSSEQLGALGGTPKLEELRAAASNRLRAQQIFDLTDEFADPHWSFRHQAQEALTTTDSQFNQALDSATSTADRTIVRQAARADWQATRAELDIDELARQASGSSAVGTSNNLLSGDTFSFHDGYLQTPSNAHISTNHYVYNEISGHIPTTHRQRIAALAHAEGASYNWLHELTEKGTTIRISDHRAPGPNASYHYWYDANSNRINIANNQVVDGVTTQLPPHAIMVQGQLLSSPEHLAALRRAVDEALPPARTVTPAVGSIDDVARVLGDDDVYFHYTSDEGFAQIMESNRITPGESGNVFVTQDPLTPGETHTHLFAGNPSHTGRGDNVIVVRKDPGTSLREGTQPNERVHQGAMRLGNGNEVIYAGPNPF